MGIDFKSTGRGSGFHPEPGSNSAYFLEKDSGMVLIDCGESIFAKPSTDNDHLHAAGMKILITHTHEDHAGSLMSTHKKEHMDCSFSENPVHMDIHTIGSMFPDGSWKSKITMMRFNGIHASDTARAMGYKTAIDLMV